MYTHCRFRVAAAEKIQHVSRIYYNTTDLRLRAMCSQARNAYAFQCWRDSMKISHVIIAYADTQARKEQYGKPEWEAANDFDRLCQRHGITTINATAIQDVTDMEIAQRRLRM